MSSNTVDFKLAPFQINTIWRDGLTQLITRQNNFLSNSMTTSVKEGGHSWQYFNKEDNSIAGICLDAPAKDRMFMFHTVEPGKHNQRTFVHPKHMQVEDTECLESVFTHFLQDYEADYCLQMLEGEGNICRELKLANLLRITEYLKNLNLSLVTNIVQKRETGLLLLPNKKHKSVLALVFRKIYGSVWGTKLHGEENRLSELVEQGKKGGYRVIQSFLT